MHGFGRDNQRTKKYLRRDPSLKRWVKSTCCVESPTDCLQEALSSENRSRLCVHDLYFGFEDQEFSTVHNSVLFLMTLSLPFQE